MLFSLRWLLEYCPVRTDPDAAAAALTDRGLTVDSLEARGDDHVLDVDVPANRPDCLGHLGLARELAAALAPGGHPTLFAVPYVGPAAAKIATAGPSVEDEVELEIESAELCPRYTARIVRNVRVGPSPAWVVERLELCGLRSINNVVDASNLVLLGLGHPIHFFDLAALQPAVAGGRPSIVVRAPRSDELGITTLDGEVRSLEPDTVLIADGQTPIALAGVMGGRETEIGETTRDVLIEAAAFAPGSIRRTSRRLALQTDASFRFARGVDPAGVPAAQTMAVELLTQFADGTAAPGLLDAYPRPATARSIDVSGGEVDRLLGYEPTDALLRASLDALGLEPSGEADGTFRIRVPSYRFDLDREADVVEEVARHLGYDRIPSRDPSGASGGRPPARAVEERCRDLLAECGFHEAFSYAMVGDADDEPYVSPSLSPAIRLDNPIAETMSTLRRSVLPGLVRAAELNQRRGARDVRLFEIGHVFHAVAGRSLPEEPRRLGFVWSGAGEPRHWSRDPRSVDLYDAIGLVERTLVALAPELQTNRESTSSPASAFHPGRSLRWMDGAGRCVAWAGELHPDLAASLDSTPVMAEVELDRLVPHAESVATYSGISRFPSASRDLSLVMPSGLAYSRILEVLERIESPAPVAFEVIDRYAGPPLPEDRVSLTVRLCLSPRGRTLVDEQTDGYRLKAIEALRSELGVEIRG